MPTPTINIKAQVPTGELFRIFIFSSLESLFMILGMKFRYGKNALHSLGYYL
jgi:hypothetical protein